MESPKKLRFATHHDDGTPARRRPSGVAEEEDEYSCCDRHLSVSCPCIDHLDDRSRPATTATESGRGGGQQRTAGALLQTPAAGTSSGCFPRVNSAPVTPMAADCMDMTDVSSLADDVNEPLIRAAADGCRDAITFV